MTLDERKKKILESIIRDYVETAEPVGSRAMVKKHDLKISAATVRNEMADLEDMGYLEQPHTSAGRIPSESGFRYYVDCMMEKEPPGEREYALLQQLFEQNIEDWEQVIIGIAHFLSQMTRYASFVIVPSVRFTEFRNLQLLPLDQGKALLLLVCDMGVIMHRIISIPEFISSQDLQAITGLFNQAFIGKRLEEVKRSDLQLIRENLSQRRQIIDNALEAIDNLLQNSRDEKVMVSGALNILNEPEFKDMDKLKRILNVLEEDDSLRQIIPGELGEAVDIKIGRENPLEEIKEMSLVVAGYKSFGELGKIGVIGPVRMEYWKAVGTVETVRDIIEDYLKGLG